MNAVESFFSKLSSQRLKNAIFNSLGECVGATEVYIENRSANDAGPVHCRRNPGDLVVAWE